MNIFHKINQNIQDIFNPVNLKLATAQSLHASEVIKNRVRVKLDKLTEEQRVVSAYADLLLIHDKIEKNHDDIYQRPNSGVNPQDAKDDCIKIVLAQEELESSFNVKYAEITLDPVVLEENATLQAERMVRDVKDAAEQVNLDAIAKANEVAAYAKDHAADARETMSDRVQDLGQRVGNAVEDVKEDLTSPKPRFQ